MKFLRESMPSISEELAHKVSTTFNSHLILSPVQASTGVLSERGRRFPSQSASLTQSFVLVAPWPAYTTGIITHPPPQPHSLLSVTTYAASRIVQPTPPLRRECSYTGFLDNRIPRHHLNNHLQHHNGFQCLRRGHPRAGSCARGRHRGRAVIRAHTTATTPFFTWSHRTEPTNARTQCIRSIARFEQPRWR